MRNWLTFTAISTLLCALVVIIVINACHSEIIPLHLDLDSEFMPGNQAPPGSYCDWRLAMTATWYCVAVPKAGEHVSFDVDRYKGTIVRTAVSPAAPSWCGLHGVLVWPGIMRNNRRDIFVAQKEA